MTQLNRHYIYREWTNEALNVSNELQKSEMNYQKNDILSCHRWQLFHFMQNYRVSRWLLLNHHCNWSSSQISSIANDFTAENTKYRRTKHMVFAPALSKTGVESSDQNIIAWANICHLRKDIIAIINAFIVPKAKITLRTLRHIAEMPRRSPHWERERERVSKVTKIEKISTNLNTSWD